MIQRVQSLYLLISAVLTSLVLAFPLYTAPMEGSIINVDFMGATWTSEGNILGETSHPYVLILVILSAVMSLVTIFMFNNRPIQMKLARFSGLLNTGLLVAIFFAVETAKEMPAGSMEVMGDYGLACLLPIGGMILGILAGRAILKDEAMVRSADRLR